MSPSGEYNRTHKKKSGVPYDNMSMYISIWDHKAIKQLVRKGYYPSKCEFVRAAIRDKLEKEREFYKGFVKPLGESEDPATIRVPNGDGTYKIYIRNGEA
ncbi:MAG: ribbon-helix-helix domain-containing protein [Candidatus Thorarchaeota archaeon]